MQVSYTLLLAWHLCFVHSMERLVVLPVALQTNNTRTSWDAVWMAPEEIAKEGIMISPHLLDDHYTVTLEVTDLFLGSWPFGSWPFGCSV